MPTGGAHQQQILPNYDVFANPPPQTMPLVGRPSKGGTVSPRGPSGMGSPLGIVSPALSVISPLAAAAQAVRQTRGMGQVGGGMLGGLITWAVLLGAGGWLSYQAAEAMAPSPADAKKWGWIGVPVGLLTGAFGLGVMGWMAQRR